MCSKARCSATRTACASTRNSSTRRSGAHLWADRFEEDVADLFKLQDQVVARLANTLGYELIRAEAEKGGRSNNPDAIDLAMRGQALLQQGYVTKENNDAARALFERALAIDPNYAAPLADNAYTYFIDYVYGWANPETDYEAKIIAQADGALALDPDNWWAHAAKCGYLNLSQRASEGLSCADAALAVNPNFGPLYAWRGVAETSLGRFEQAKSDLRQAMRLSPRDPRIGVWYLQVGSAELEQGHYDAAIDELHKALDAGYRAYMVYGNLAAAYALAGKMDEANSAWRKPAASIPVSLSNGRSRIRRTCRGRSKACARRGCRRSECSSRRRPCLGERLPSPKMALSCLDDAR